MTESKNKEKRHFGSFDNELFKEPFAFREKKLRRNLENVAIISGELAKRKQCHFTYWWSTVQGNIIYLL